MSVQRLFAGISRLKMTVRALWAVCARITSSVGQTSPESLTISLYHLKPCKNIHQRQPCFYHQQEANVGFQLTRSTLSRYVARPHAAPVRRPVPRLAQRLPEVLGRRGHHEPSQLRYSLILLFFFMKLNTRSTNFSQSHLREEESDQNLPNEI